MDDKKIKGILEALLMSSEKSLTLEQLMGVFEDWQKPSREKVIYLLKELAQEYEDRAIELKQFEHGYCLQTKADYGIWISRLYAEKPNRYSRALLETLAIIAYKQPVTRADIEEIRGVSISSPMLKTLVERDWVKVAGFRDVPGKPAVFVTTKTFLDYFNLRSLDDLPSLSTSMDPLLAINENL